MMKNVNSKDAKKTSQQEINSSYILNTYKDDVKWKLLKTIACNIGEFANNHIFISYISMVVIFIILTALKINPIVAFVVIFILFLGLYNSHKFFINEIIRLRNKKIVAVKGSRKKKNKKTK